MKNTTRAICLLASGLLSASVVASPSYLITHNNTNVESNAYIDGTIPSPYPTKPHKTKKLMWALVKLACMGHVKDDKCNALVMMKTNSKHPVELGTVSMQLNTGDITPKSIVANGYTLHVDGPGEVTLTANEAE